MKTVGLDFGTHQSKICVETKEGAELNYEFFKFKDRKGEEHYTLPSIIHVDEKGLLSYGYLPEKKKKSSPIKDFRLLSSLLTTAGKPTREKGEIIRYFKQATFTSTTNGMTLDQAINYSIWYISFILFELQEKYGQDFSIQMGVPSDAANLTAKKQRAVRLLLSAFRLVEEVFENDKEKFLATPIDKLTELTEFVAYDEEQKELYGLLVFPEAYACLMPLIQSAKIARGMSLMVDIGGGTTDISFFTIEKNESDTDMPQVYAFYSLPKGLNYLTDADNMDKNREDSNVHDTSEIHSDRREIFYKEINDICFKLLQELENVFKLQCSIPIQNLRDALKARPLVYSGGGSTFDMLRKKHHGFSDITHVSAKQWQSEAVTDMRTIEALGLCSILSTAYGLSKSVADDNIRCKPFKDIFKHLSRSVTESNQNYSEHNYSVYNDWDAIK